MAFEYLNGKATDKSLGLELREDPRFLDSNLPSVELRSIPGDQSWRFPTHSEKGERVYETKDGPRTHLFDVAYLLPLATLGEVAEELAALKTKQGMTLSREEWLEAIRQGVFALRAQGGAYLKSVPDLSVQFMK